jgi:hypothetical protein
MSIFVFVFAVKCTQPVLLKFNDHVLIAHRKFILSNVTINSIAQSVESELENAIPVLSEKKNFK